MVKNIKSSNKIISKLVREHHLFNCNDINSFISTIKVNLPYGGYSMSQFFINEIDNYKFFTKLHFHKKTNPEIYGNNDSKNLDVKLLNQGETEITILNLLKENFIETGKISGIIEIIESAVCTGKIANMDTSNCMEWKKSNTKDFESYIMSMFCEQKELISEGIAYDSFSFIVMEHADISLKKFISKYINKDILGYQLFKSILFQVIHTLSTIQKVYPGFKHNDLHTDNVIISIDHDFSYNPMNMKYIKYTINDEKFIIPYYGCLAKIIDFGFSVIPELNIYSSIIYEKVIMRQRPYSDLLFLMTDVYHTCENDAVEILIEELDDTGYYINSDVYLLKNKKIKHTFEFLKNKNWDDYRKFEVNEDHIIMEFNGDFNK